MLQIASLDADRDLLAAPLVQTLTAALCLLLLTASGALSAQSPVPGPDPEAAPGGNLSTPSNWQVRLDYPSNLMQIGANEESDVYFVNMVPGWHIRTKPAAIFWPNDSRIEGNYRLEAVFHLFDPEGRNEGYGLFFGGVNLNADDITYDYFLVRNSGEFLIKGRGGVATELLHDWSSSFEIRPFTDVTESSVTNRLGVVAGGSEVVFEINGVEVARLPRNQVNTEGGFGVRINHFVEVHLSSLTVTPLDASPGASSGAN